MGRDCIKSWKEENEPREEKNNGTCLQLTGEVTLGGWGKTDCVKLWELYGDQQYDDWSEDTWKQQKEKDKAFILNEEFFKDISKCAKKSIDPNIRWTCVPVS
jgi:hypothetical protein